MGKALKTAGMIIGAVALVATGVGAAALIAGGASFTAAVGTAASLSLTSGIGVSLGTLSRIGMGLAFLGDATSKPLKVGTAAGSPTDFAADPNAPIPLVIGRTGTAGRIIYATTGEAKNRNALFNTVLSLGPVRGNFEFRADNETVTFGPLQQALYGRFANRMWMNIQLGDTPSPAFGPPNTLDPAVLSEWTTDHKLSGLCAAWFVRDSDQKTYPNGTPKPLWIMDGGFSWDPRLDSTWPGGSGSCRRDDPATWPWSECPYINGLAWSLGHFHNGERIMGIGARVEAIDVAAFIEAANVSDANGWKVGGVAYSTDSKWDVLKAMCQAGGGRPLLTPSQITVLVNAPRTAIATLTEDDIAGACTVPGMTSVRNRPNQIIPTYRSPDHAYEMVAAGAVKVPAYVTQDRGRTRSRGVAYPFIQDAKQAAIMAAYDLVNAREIGPIAVPCKPQWRHYKRGDCITVEAAQSLAMDGMKVLILDREYDPMTGDVTLILQSETDEKHDFALGRTANPPPLPELHGVDLFPVEPAVGSWAVTAALLVGSDGSKQPAIVVIGAVDDQNASNVIVDYKPDGGAWASVEVPASATRIEIAPVMGTTTYQVRVRYRSVRGLQDPAVYLALGAVTTGGLVAGDAAKLGDVTADQVKHATEVVGKAQQLARDTAMRLAKDALDAWTTEQKAEEKIRSVFDKPLGPVLAEHRETIAEHRVTVAENTAAIELETLTRITEVSAEAALRDALNSQFMGFKSTATAELATLNTEQESTAASLVDLTADHGAFKSSASTTLIAHSTNLLALAAADTTLTATMAANKASADAGMLVLTDDQKALATKHATLVAQVDDNYAEFDERVTISTTKAESAGSKVDLLKVDYEGNKSTVSGQLTILANDTMAMADDIDELSVVVDDNYAEFDGRVTIATTKAESAGSKVDLLKTDYEGNKSSVSGKLTVLSDADTALADDLEEVQAQADGLGATVTSHSSTLVDVTNKIAVGRLVLEAAASGGRPARVSLYSDTYGASNVALVGDSIDWGDDTTFDDATNTLRSVTGSIASVLAIGASFGTDSLRMWVGSSSVGLASATRANATFYLADNAPYIGGSGYTAGKAPIVQGGSFYAYVGYGVGTQDAAYISMTLPGPGTLVVTISGASAKDTSASQPSVGTYRLYNGGTALTDAAYCSAKLGDGAAGSQFGSTKKVTIGSAGSYTFTLKVTGGGSSGSDTGTANGDVTVLFIPD